MIICAFENSPSIPSNDGATILKQMQVLHPAAKMVGLNCNKAFHKVIFE
jgi:chaperonin GroEL (HSP60 family)